MLDKAAGAARRALLGLASNEALFLFAVFVSQGVLSTDPFAWYQEAVSQLLSLVVVPWGAALCLLRLERRAAIPKGKERLDLLVLFALLVWVSVPFFFRFGFTFNTSYSWFNHTVLFFGFYALIVEDSPVRRERTLDWAGALFALLGAALAVPTLYCVLTGRSLGAGTGGIPFGLTLEGQLQFGQHYNSTAMLAQCCALFALLGACRRKRLLTRLLHLLPALAMAAVVVLSQSRTARLALLGALAVGCYGVVAGALAARGRAVRHAAALAAALIAFAAGFWGAKMMTDTALLHYARVRQSAAAPSASSSPSATPDPSKPAANTPAAAAAATPADKEPAEETPVPVTPAKARSILDSTLSERTLLWRNLFAYWREHPKRLLLGNGMGNTGRIVIQGTSQEGLGGIAVHNTYLQFIADYGLIGFILMAVFLCSLAPSCLRTLLAPKGTARAGDRVLVVLVVCKLLEGLMESQPLGAMSLSNLALFFALAMLRARDPRAAGACQPQGAVL